MTNPMHQTSFASSEYEAKGYVTQREKFLGQMNAIVPWTALITAIEPFYPTGERGRPPIGIERMLRMYFLQQWYSNLSDVALEDSLYDITSMRHFAGIDLSCERVPDATTLLKFRHLLEGHDLTAKMLQTINLDLEQRGLLMRAGTIVDATLIAAPSSTKNKDHQRDPEMRQTKKGNNYHFGMKAHIGVDADSGVVHTVISTPANVHDVTQALDLLHGQESDAYGDSGYRGVEKRQQQAKEKEKMQSPQWHIAMMPAKRTRLKSIKEDCVMAQTLDKIEKLKASIRAKVEHPFHIIKNLFKYKKTSYRGIAKNAARHTMLFALANLVIVKKSLLVSEHCRVQKVR